MENAYDLKDLGARLKAKGLVEVEDAAGEFYTEFKAWLEESAKLSENPWDDMAVPFLKQVDPIVLPQIDKIDGETSQE